TSNALQPLFRQYSGAIVFTYGDTNTTLAAAMAAKRAGMVLHHFEGGIRTGDLSMPEEMNRIITDRLADVNYCCTALNYNTLKNEGYGAGISGKTFLTGDLMFDAFLKTKPIIPHLNEKEYIACTIHRAANIGNAKTLLAIVNALNYIHKQIPVLVPLHPHTKKRLKDYDIQPKFNVLPPLGYKEMKGFLQNSNSVITDSGGVSREAYFSSKKSLIISPVLFWPEIGLENCSLSALPQTDIIIERYNQLQVLSSNFSNHLFGKGNAAEKIHSIIQTDTGR
ncbi:MAG: UDP-N-acetylglucosamine 2-epimerase, partial [Niabella sp.]